MRCPQALALQLIGLSLLVTLCGCATFRSGECEVESWTAASPQRTLDKSISVLVAGEASFNGKEAEVTSKILNVWREQTVRAYRDSGLFTSVTSAPSGTDLRAEIKIEDRGEGSLAMAFLTGLTLYLIPSKASDALTTTTVFRDQEGKELSRHSKSESIVLWQQLFMLFAMPANNPFSTTKDVIYDLNRATLVEAFPEG
jgi:hypothetical protein